MTTTGLKTLDYRGREDEEEPLRYVVWRDGTKPIPGRFYVNHAGGTFWWSNKKEDGSVYSEKDAAIISHFFQATDMKHFYGSETI